MDEFELVRDFVGDQPPPDPAIVATARMRPADVRRWWPAGTRGRLLTIVVLALTPPMLFLVYYARARTIPPASDGSSNALQAWDMLHGNLLLSGWSVSDVSFYTTEVPEWALVELVRGIGPGVIYAGAALTYTSVVLLAALLAKGRVTGRSGLLRALIGGGIMVAPLWNGLLSNPDHIGTQAPLLLVWLIVDRARPRWWVPVVVGLLLAWTQVADTLTLYEGVLPLAAVCLVRIYRRRLACVPADQGWRRLVREGWYEASLALAAVVGACASVLALRLINAAGGFTVLAPSTVFAAVSEFGTRLGVTAQSVLLLYSADFSSQPLRTSIGALVHLAGLALAVWAVSRAYRRFWRQDLVTQALAVAVAVLLLAYTFTGNPSVGGGAHEISGLLPIGAVLAGRLLVPSLVRARLLPALAIVLAACSATLARQAIQAPQPGVHAQIDAWLETHHLSYGLATYWDANAVTVATHNQVRVRPVSREDGKLVLSPWESVASWYDPAANDARFFLLNSDYTGCPDPLGTEAAWLSSIEQTFGPPTKEYWGVDGYDVLVWSHNLLGERLAAAPPDNPLAC